MGESSSKFRDDDYEKTTAARPFVKWAGGKRQLLPELLKRLPAKFNRYFEPFVGGGALFFRINPEKAYLSDINEELINAYKVIQDRPNDLIRDLSKHRYERAYYEELRNVDRKPAYSRWGSVRKASRLIYLNKTCFNGLYRVNSQGQFNTPFGRYENPIILDEANLLACHQCLRKARIFVASFDEVLKKAKRGDFVYFDPPYAPLSATAYFTGYSKKGFDGEMQVRLRDVCNALDKKGVQFMVSNSSAPLIIDLYANFRLERVKAGRAINSKGNKRGKIDEVIVRNY